MIKWKSVDMKLEIEKTFKISEMEKRNLLKLLLSCDFGDVVLKKKKVSCVLHFIIADYNLSLKKRIKVVYINEKKKQLQVLYAPKMRISDTQNDVQVYLEDKVIIDEIKKLFPFKIYVGALYLKKGIKITYKFKEKKWVVGIDEVWNINPWNKNCTNNLPQCYVEIEGRSEDSIDFLLNLLLSKFKANLQLLEKDESKIKIDSMNENRDKFLQFKDFDEFRTFAWEIYHKYIGELRSD